MLRLFLKFAATALLLAIVVSRVDIGAVGRMLAGADPLLMALALLLSLAMAVADAAQWRSVLHALGHRLSLGTAILYSVVGCFFGNLGPSAMGVDIFRAAQMRRLGISTQSAIRATLSSRLVAFVALLAVIATGIPLVYWQLQPEHQLLLVSAFATGLACLIAILAFQPIRNRVPYLQRSSFVKKFSLVSEDLANALIAGRNGITSLVFATATHVLRVSIFAAIAAALGANVGFTALYALVPIAMLIAMMPITLGSWGIREASIVFFLGMIGVPTATALAISVTFGVSRLVMAAIGGVVWVLTRSDHYSHRFSDGTE